MTNKATKVMVLGIDAPIPPRVYGFAREGKLPALGALMARGVVGTNCLGPLPTITPTNWTTIVTGAWPGTHHITDFEGHVPGDPLDVTHQNLDAREVAAEQLWKAAERAGKRSILVNYPTTWNADLKDGWQVGGYGLHANDWRYQVARREMHRDHLCKEILLTTQPYPFGSEVTLKKAHGWQGVEHTTAALEATVTPLLRGTLRKVEPFSWHLLVDSADGHGYDTVLVAESKDRQGVLARLSVGEWSDAVYRSFRTEVGPEAAVFRMKLLELSPDAAQLRIFIPGLCALHGWGVPSSLEEEIKSENGLPLGRAPWDTWLLEWIDSTTMVETADFHNIWLADAATYLLRNKPWDLYFMHIHTPDGMYHVFSSDLDPLTAKDEALRADVESAELALYQSVDRCIGRIVAEAPEDTVIIVISDHGAKAKTASFNVRDVLEQAGLLVYKPAGEGQVKQIDWSQTKAVNQRWVHIYVNTKGRDPDGIVEPGEEYEAVCDQVIKALHEYVDPVTGRKPISLALKRADARILGHYDDWSGDVVFAVNPDFGKEHGVHLPTARIGIGDMRSMFILAGPGVKQGAELERTIWLTDIVPTLCYLAELPVPLQCEGAVIYQSLEDPDAQVKEMQALRRNVERLKRMVERPPMC
jgi:predicted AlkP superfamily phosphohydrolase/phosphomutase